VLLKRTITGMSKTLHDEISWPSDDELENKSKDFVFFQNADFGDVACVTEMELKFGYHDLQKNHFNTVPTVERRNNIH
jgi:hypothetical protein